MTTRRDFLRIAAAGGSALGLGWLPLGCEGGPGASRGPLNILILGGTGFTGPHQIAYALQRGHNVTIFNRGQRETEVPPEVTRLYGDRMESDLDALRGTGPWDAVIDNPTTLPFWVRDAGQILGEATDHYIFISTISVYASNDQPGADETAATAEYRGDDPLEDRDGRQYGPLKAASEREAEKWFPGKTTVIRPGLIVGPRDTSDRWTYWPVRVDRGGEVLAPGDPEDPVQFIDARDLAEWTIRMAESRVFGTFNATSESMGFGTMLEQVKAGVGSDARFTWVPADFLQEHNARAWQDLPAWINPVGPSAGFMLRDVSRAVSNGLTFRPVSETARDTLAWWKSRPAEEQSLSWGWGANPEREEEVLIAWHS